MPPSRAMTEILHSGPRGSYSSALSSDLRSQGSGNPSSVHRDAHAALPGISKISIIPDITHLPKGIFHVNHTRSTTYGEWAPTSPTSLTAPSLLRLTHCYCLPQRTACPSVHLLPCGRSELHVQMHSNVLAEQKQKRKNKCKNHPDVHHNL
ncbi:hypothetical protein BS17DRAFT_377489 [Gyrodon lividus]|nr:hypothetical protein BS17DRAFT_377489 [Gyrodon lividus]